jgi:SNF2 family DNA or RNA helicase
VSSLDPRLHDYQVRAIEHLHGTGEPGAALFLDMGLGKTATVLQALTPEHLPAVVFAPTRVAKEVWEVERDIWRPDLSMQVLKSEIGPTKEYPNGVDRRKAMLKAAEADIVVMPRDLAGDFGTRQHRYKTVVLDELSGYKSKGVRWKATRDIVRRASHVWGMTGTPIPNGYEDLYYQIFMLDKGKRLGQTVTEYRDRYFDVIKRHRVTNVVIERALKQGAQASIDRLLLDIAVSMKASDYLELPDLTFNRIKVPMNAKAIKAYRDLEEDLVADLSLLGGPDAIHTAANAAVLSSRLEQVSAGFLYVDGDTSRWTWLHDGKINGLKEIREGTGDNLLVFYWFGAERDRILNDRDLNAVSIDEPGAVKAWNRGEIATLLAHPVSAGHGLNLQHGGHQMVYTTLPWGLEPWEQSVHRLHRQGQKNAVITHWLDAAPIDLTKFQRLEGKQSVQDALMFYLKEAHLWL